MDLATEFPLDETLCYLNHAAVAPWPKRALVAVETFARENVEQGARYYPRWEQTEQHCRELLARLINAASTDDIALVKNTSEALSMVAHGIDWQAGDNVVIPAGEFPSNRIVWESLAEYGVEVRQVDIESQDDPEKALFGQFDAKTRLLSVSSVRYDTGFRLDLAKLGRFCKQAGVLFCIDAIQGLGVVEMDVQAVQADFVMADGHKWMLGPEGLAVFYSHPASRNFLKLHEFGWRMVEEPYDFARQDWQIARSARRFECGSPNMLGIHAWYASLSLINEIGLDSISRNIFKNTSYLIDKLRNLQGVSLVTATDPARHAGIVTFRVADRDNLVLFRELMEKGVICAARGGGVRFSPHFYTPTAVLDRAIDTLADCLPR